jgi:DNA-damage-inducible protein J
MMIRVATEKALPFDLHVPNTETVEAIEEGRRGEVTTVNSVDELFRELRS